MNEDTQIRLAQSDDELGIAKVHIQAWQEAYAELISKNT